MFALVDDPKRLRLMGVLDGLNKAKGAGTLHFAHTKLSTAWQVRASNRSPRYLTCWDEFTIAYS